MRTLSKNIISLVASALIVSSTGVFCWAGQSAQSITDAGMPAECSKYAAKVSKSEGNWDSLNKFGCVGAFQFCPGTFETYYKGSKSDFIKDPSAQVSAWTKYQQDEWKKAQRNGITSLVGQEVCHGGRCAKIDQSAILMACQFGCGKGGKIYNYAQGKDCDARNVKDGNLKSVCDYLINGAGYDVSCFTGQKRADANCNPNDLGNPNLPGAVVADNSGGNSQPSGSDTLASASPADLSSPAEHPPTRDMASIILPVGAAALEPREIPEGIALPQNAL